MNRLTMLRNCGYQAYYLAGRWYIKHRGAVIMDTKDFSRYVNESVKLINFTMFETGQALEEIK